MRSWMILNVAVLLVVVGTSAHAQEAEEATADPLAELAALGDAIADVGPEAGGSIRAKRDADPALANRLKDPRNIEAKVDSVMLGRFPMVAVRVQVRKSAAEGSGKDIKKREALVLIPKLKVQGGRVDMTDADTMINAGAFYLKTGDKVMVRLGAQKGKVWEADYIERR